MAQVDSASHARDIEVSKTLHGEKVITSADNFLVKVLSKDKATHGAISKNYMKFWEIENPENECEEKNLRKEDYISMTNSYYNIATDFYEYGWCSSFHFCRFYPKEDFFRAIARHEHYLAMQLDVSPGMKVLDIGCGVGGPAREICHFTGTHVTGLNNNAYQVERAKQYSREAGLELRTEFVKGNFMEIPFEDASFDAVYAIEATCHAQKLEDVYREAFRVLKPGGKCAIYEWCVTDKYDPENPEHRKLAYGIEIGDGIPKLFTTTLAEESFKNVGFEVEAAVDLAVNNDEYPWYYPLEGDFRTIQSWWDYFTVFRMTGIGKLFTRAMVGSLEMIGIAPPGSLQTQIILETAQISLIEGGRQGIFTPMFLLAGRKPATAHT